MIICLECISKNQFKWITHGKVVSAKCDKCNSASNICFQFSESKPNQPMKEERTLKMSLETAKELYKQCIDNPALSNGVYKNWLLQNFTKEELEGNKGYTWEESYAPGGYYICADANGILVKKVINSERLDHFKSVFRTEKEALSALAFAQLSHICAKYNSNAEIRLPERGMVKFYSVVPDSTHNLLLLYETSERNSTHLPFNKKEDAIISKDVNSELWKQFWML